MYTCMSVVIGESILERKSPDPNLQKDAELCPERSLRCELRSPANEIFPRREASTALSPNGLRARKHTEIWNGVEGI